MAHIKHYWIIFNIVLFFCGFGYLCNFCIFTEPVQSRRRNVRLCVCAVVRLCLTHKLFKHPVCRLMVVERIPKNATFRNLYFGWFWCFLCFDTFKFFGSLVFSLGLCNRLHSLRYSGLIIMILLFFPNLPLLFLL